MTPQEKRYACPLCSQLTEFAGDVRHRLPLNVAGIPIDLDSIQFSLERCPGCTFQIKVPKIDENKLLECYTQASSDHWGEKVNPLERNFNVMKGMLQKWSAGKRIIDIGCFNGAFLEYMGPEWQRFGVEPGVQATEYAKKLGITMIGHTLDDVNAESGTFNAVTAIDVIEHLINPLNFFKKIASLLSKDGICLVVTGDTDAWSWRRYGSHYWYASLVEHVSFWNHRSLEEMGRNTGLEVIDYHRRSHVRPTVGRRLKDFLKNMYYLAGHSLDHRGISLSNYAECGATPMWISSADHMYAVLRLKR